MSRLSKIIFFAVFLSAAISHKFIVLAEDTTASGIIERPAVEYESSKQRDPFSTYLRKDDLNSAALENADLKPEFDLSILKVQGIIWGVNTPQAIINNEVLTVGNLIQGAKILSIEKKGITLSFKGRVYDLTIPGENSFDKKTN